MKHNAGLAVATLGFTVLALALMAPPARAGFPYNGGFEQIDKGLPVGWTAEGTWLVEGQKPYAGKKSALLPGEASQAGDRLVSAGYRFARRGDVLTVHLAYLSPTGGVVVGLIPCDALGARVGRWSVCSSLPASPSWQVQEVKFALTPEAFPEGAAAVRVYVGAEQDAVNACFDEVRLKGGSGDAPIGGRLAAGGEASARPNLLRNPDFDTRPDGTLPGWLLLAAPGFADSCETETDGGLVLRSGKQPLAWISVPVSADLALPYEVSVAYREIAPPGFSVLARVRDPEELGDVWMQEAAARHPGDGGTIVCRLPRLSSQSQTALIEVALLLGPGDGQRVVVTSAALRPEPVSLSVRPVAMTGEFAHVKDVQLFISAVNNTDRPLRPTAHLKVLDAEQKAVFYEPRPVKIGPQSAGYFPVKPKLTRPGDYVLLVRLLENGRDLGSTTYAFRVSGE